MSSAFNLSLDMKNIKENSKILRSFQNGILKTFNIEFGKSFFERFKKCKILKKYQEMSFETGISKLLRGIEGVSSKFRVI